MKGRAFPPFVRYCYVRGPLQRPHILNKTWFYHERSWNYEGPKAVSVQGERLNVSKQLY